MNGARIGPIIALCLLLAPAVDATGPNWLHWLDNEVFKKVKLSGYRILGFHSYKVRGDSEAFNSLNFYGLGSKTFTDFGQLRVQGRQVAGVLNFQANILDSRFEDPQGQKWSLDYVRNGWSVNAGDILGSVNYNRFAYFNKSLRGVSVGYTKGRFSGKVLTTQARGSARTVTLQGNNSPGPYYLQTNQVVRGSEAVEIDGEAMEPVRDYVVNYELGAITFINRIISPSSSIIVTYEALGFNTAPGVVRGLGLSYDFGKIGKLSVTGLHQIARSDGSGSTFLESFQGFGPPSTPYILQFEPAPARPLLIKVDGIDQVLGRDYTFDPQSPSIFYMTRFVPSSSTIDVIYTPKPRGTADGDRESYGVEYAIPLGKGGKNGQLSVSQAFGRLKSDLTPLSGIARGASLRYTTGKFEFAGAVRDVPADFVTVETRGFSRNDRTIDWNLLYKQTPTLQYGIAAKNSAVATRTVDSEGESRIISSRFSMARAYAQFRPEKGGFWTAEQKRTESRYLGQGTKLDTTALTYGKPFAKGDVRLSYERQDGHGPVRSGNIVERGRLHIDTVRLGASYVPKEGLTIAGSGGISAISAGGDKGTGKDYSLTVAYQPSQRFRVGTEYALSESGSLAALSGFQNGYGLGFDGNGFSGGTAGSFALGATDYRIFKVVAEYNPSERISVNADITNQRAAGSVTSNSETTSFGVGGVMDLGKGHQVSATIDQSNTRFVDSDLKSEATNLNLFLTGSPPGRLSYRLGLSLLLTGGTSEFQQDSKAYEASLLYRLANRQNLSFSISSGSISGYYPQDNFNISLIYQYQIWRNLALNVGYKIIDVKNRDPLVTTGAYRASGFDIELNFNFGGF